MNETEFQTKWRSPSNIALVKYWGKYGRQMPRNPSVSFTLTNAYSETSLRIVPRETMPSETTTNEKIALDFLFEGKENLSFRAKQVKFLEGMHEHFPWLQSHHLSVSSINSFPHSAGIASSASAMSALALGLCEYDALLHGKSINDADFLQKVSVVSRLGSGSACRSVFPKLAMWGALSAFAQSSDEYAVEVSDAVDTIFHTYHDDILLVSSAEKSVSSRAGHSLMEDNPFAKPRYAQATQNLTDLMQAMRIGDLARFGDIVENEALTLHALMLCSQPSFILLKPNSLAIIEKIRDFRTETRLPISFTIDAGPNIHVLYPDAYKTEIQSFIHAELLPLCENRRMVADMVGEGARKV
jgi:diphosphomevalonate decarboxylase